MAVEKGAEVLGRIVGGWLAMVGQLARRVILAWAGVDRVACWFAVGMILLSLVMDNSLCTLTAMGAALCLSVAAWRGERWDLREDFSMMAANFQAGWNNEPPKAPSPPKEYVDSKPTEQAPATVTHPAPPTLPRIVFTDSFKVREPEISVLDMLRQRFDQRLVGQLAARDLVLNRLASLTLGTRPRTKAPISFLFVGPTGTGKGELASLVAEVMGRKVTKFNMSEYTTIETLWTLLGSPKGYVNPEEGLLTRAARNDPRGVLFLDEIEKGHPNLYNLFLSILDDKDGSFNDMKTGQNIRCSDMIVIFASNLLSDLNPEEQHPQNTLRDGLRSSGQLRPELVARVSTIVPFYQFTAEELWRITERQLLAYLEDVCKRRQCQSTITVDREVVEYLVSRQDPKYGARNVQTSIEESVEPAIREALVHAGNRPPAELHLRKTSLGDGIEMVTVG